MRRIQAKILYKKENIQIEKDVFIFFTNGDHNLLKFDNPMLQCPRPSLLPLRRSPLLLVFCAYSTWSIESEKSKSKL